ncbi:CPBP family intramembrane metalloprotease [Trichococcus sp. K1Tr]|uniref:CPBP family intramembrane glutamic endopeptidase n=1 Tax=Trichococcus sp. K1Tr TaxID=3020847 RepID=UPI00232D4F2F|nr:CPBP family intramembrane glutamic endopeptidase [Trichococcus sp. K1Tr]MDB6353502.1 CPBP family intramembrane metalloprotease [Trichococcus sp. K1Tr]
MERLYKKNELFFALMWIAVYVIGISTADGLSEEIGILKVITLPVALVLSFFLYGWIRKNKLQQYYGLRPVASTDYRKYLYFLPLIVLSTANLWNGVVFEQSFLDSVLFIICMLFIGFLEEVIFRGFLFKALSRKSVRSAMLISSVTFGMGHIVNLLNGADFLPTLLQIGYATAIGFLFTVLFMKTKSLWPGILAHAVINATSLFAVEGDGSVQLISSLVMVVLSVGYALYLLMFLPEK